MDDSDLTVRLCEIVGALPIFAWRPNGPVYTASEIGVFYGTIPDAPDRAVGIRVYSPIDEPDLLSRRVQLHVRGGRGLPFGADRIAGVLFSVFHERARGDGIVSIRRTSAVPLGADGNGREERTENYLVVLDNVEAAL
ncbi:minor capsid protein [Microbacterium sp. YJN-G]|uniref:minor capsid protein n=1 Tax=Microbacterium sp. YJN-G TaxID=2763257 RepID=UPI001878247E|nr:minor capsid protein [Microbacterium sp. YJN-G]